VFTSSCIALVFVTKVSDVPAKKKKVLHELRNIELDQNMF
jgi:hypothetical protein